MDSAEGAQSYLAWYSTPLGRLADRLEKEVVFPALGEVVGKRVLDLGCGPGTYSFPLSHRGARVIGVDISPAMLYLARRRGREEGLALSLIRGTATALPFPSQSFDRVVAITVLEFLPQPEKALAEIWRVLKPGGAMVVGALNRHSLWHWLREVRGRRTPGCRPFTPGEMLRLLEPYGRVGWWGCLFLPPFHPGPLLPLFLLWERLARRLVKGWGAFLVFRVEKLLAD